MDGLGIKLANRFHRQAKKHLKPSDRLDVAIDKLINKVFITHYQKKAILRSQTHKGMKGPVALAQFNGYHPKDMMELDHYEYIAITDTLYNATKKSDGTVYKIEIMPLQQMCCDPSDCMLFCKKCPVVEKSRICLHRIRYWFPMFLYHKIVTYINV